MARSLPSRIRLVALTAVAACAVPAAVALAAGPSADAAPRPAKQQMSKVIVLLRDQHSSVPATRHDAIRRDALVRHDQAPLTSRISALGGRTTHRYAALNAVAATIPSNEVAALKADPSVAAVEPDLVRRLVRPVADTAARHAAAGPHAVTPSQVCPTDPSKPLLEPEGLSLTHTDSDDPDAKTARSLGVDGDGVKVAVIADGLDVDQPDLIRPDGSHVITDYRDFSGDGTNTTTSGAEIFGDASSVAAQGRTSYDISNYVSPAHPLPAGCTIRVEGMAPGASLVALKVFSNELLTAPTSTIIQAIDWAVNTDHVDVINESFGSNPYPDTADDPISVFNHNAVDAGVTVVASTGDAGTGNTLGTAATDPWVIAAGATTSEKVYAQETLYGFQLGNGRYTSNQLSSLSSGGISQLGRVQDLLAPGDLNWSICSDKLLESGDPQYVDCTDNNGNPSQLQTFGGTSESAPFTAGAAALVIQAYRDAHDGASPTPADVRRFLDSSADDLHLPAELQGAGLLDSYRAVQLARSAPSAGLSLDKSQVNVTATSGSTASGTFTATNNGSATQRVTAKLRAVNTVASRTSHTVSLNATTPAHTFVDGFGISRSYVETTFKVAPGTDRLADTVSWGGPIGPIVRVSLLDPQGTYAGYSLPQGAGNFGRVELHDPAPGTWTEIVWTSSGSAGYTGNVDLTETSYHASSAGTVSPSSFTLAPGASQKLTVSTTAPSSAASASSLVLTSGFGATTVASMVVRSKHTLVKGKTDTISGTFDTANGRDYSPGQSITYLFAVPSGAPTLTSTIKLAGTPSNLVVAHLSDPYGEPVETVANQHPTSDEDTTLDPGLQIVHANPVSGLWQLTLELTNPAASVPQPFTVATGLAAAPVTSHGIPTSTSTRVSKRTGSTQTVTITNTGPAPQTYFVEARTSDLVTLPLVAKQSASETDPYTASADLPLQDSTTVPAWLTPTESTNITVGASATAPITFDVMPLNSPTALNAPNDPDTESTTGTSASASHSAPGHIGSALWAAFPSLVGPAPADGQSGENALMQASVTTRKFYGDYTSSTGNPMLNTVDADAPAATPVTIAPGHSATVTLHLKPTAATGSQQRGSLYVETIQASGAAGQTGYADVQVALPFLYTVAS